MADLFSQPDKYVSRTTLQANQLAASAARSFVRASLTDPGRDAPESRAITEDVVENAELLVSELVTNAVMHAGTDIDVVCSLEYGRSRPRRDNRRVAAIPEQDRETGAAAGKDGGSGGGGSGDGDSTVGVIVEVADRHPSSVVRAGMEDRSGGRGFGLHMVGVLAEAWGVSYNSTQKSVWFRLEASQNKPRSALAPVAGLPRALREARSRAQARPADRAARTAEWPDQGGPSFLAEVSELLAGQLDEDMVAALAGQLLVPRLADWCGVWLAVEGGGMRLSRVWHAEEWRIDALRRELTKDPPPATLRTAGVPWPWPESADDDGTRGSALAFPLVAGGACHGVLILGRTGLLHMTDGVANMVQDVARRVAQAVVTARAYTRQTTISRALQRRQLPGFLASIPGVETAIVYEPHGEGQTVGGDFYDLFPMGDRRWSFLLGDVQGKDPEAMSVTGLARHLVRLLAREGHGVESVLERLNVAMAEESAEAVAFGGEQARPRFLSLLYGELEIGSAEGPRLTVASAGHPLPLRLTAGGSVVPAAEPQMLLGIDDGADFEATTFTLAPGETLLCVTDGVTERRSGNWQLDDDDGLSEVLRDCVGLSAKAVAERVRQAAHDFDTKPVEDDLSVLVLQAVPVLKGDWGAEARRLIR